jgi:cytoskeletal protein CcmA (bactofilin family)
MAGTPNPLQSDGPGPLVALLGEGARFEGKLYFEGNLRIEGDFRGQIQSPGTLVVGPGATVTADIEVGLLIVQGGQIEGNVSALEGIEVYAPSRVVGSLRAPEVSIERGARFEGSCTMGSVEVPDPM